MVQLRTAEKQGWSPAHPVSLLCSFSFMFRREREEPPPPAYSHAPVIFVSCGLLPRMSHTTTPTVLKAVNSLQCLVCDSLPFKCIIKWTLHNHRYILKFVCSVTLWRYHGDHALGVWFYLPGIPPLTCSDLYCFSYSHCFLFTLNYFTLRWALILFLFDLFLAILYNTIFPAISS